MERKLPLSVYSQSPLRSSKVPAETQSHSRGDALPYPPNSKIQVEAIPKACTPLQNCQRPETHSTLGGHWAGGLRPASWGQQKHVTAHKWPFCLRLQVASATPKPLTQLQVLSGFDGSLTGTLKAWSPWKESLPNTCLSVCRHPLKGERGHRGHQGQMPFQR